MYNEAVLSLRPSLYQGSTVNLIFGQMTRITYTVPRNYTRPFLKYRRRRLERFSLDCRFGIGFGFGFGFTTSFGWLVYLLWFWFYDSQVKTALSVK